MRTLIAIGCMVAALPLLAQTTTTTDTTGTMSSTTTTTTTTTTKKTLHHVSSRASHTRVWNTATRLASLLSDAQNTKANLSPNTWKSIANESNALANRLVAETGGRADAREARTHVREMRSAALKGDADGARSHAGLALPFVYKVIDWAAPKS